ncbi:CAP domain-containing protein [Hydrogenophaga sp.]|uniref:CAP domain-containing protein n=1 Tax=Hydrogenophaga sp. TaxID=1904254 RepID=UPI0027341A04|nr:CAP domain-containing protein [Hydrogenophaga sp.]MDP3886547.1 CAP domain-containing protein [Hydrogenophaga sp.]
MRLTNWSFCCRAGSWLPRSVGLSTSLLVAFAAGAGHSVPARAGDIATRVADAADRVPALSLPDTGTGCGLPGFQAALERRINAARAVARSCGSTVMPADGPLVWNDRLFSAAARHARDMATRNYFSHTSLDGRSLAQRVTAEGYPWTSVGENLAAGQATVDGVISGWLASPGHCRNLMSRQFEAVGVSCVRQAGSRFGHHWVMVLARP